MSLSLLRASLRSYRRILLLSVGVMLAVSLIAGINIGIETLSSGVLESYIKNVSYDITAQQYDINASYPQVNQEIALLPEVTRVETILSLQSAWQVNMSFEGHEIASQQFRLMGLSNEFPTRYNVTVTQGNWNLTEGVVLSDGIANSLSAKPGDWVNISMGYRNPSSYTGSFYWIKQVKIAGIAVFSDQAQNLMYGGGGGYFYYSPGPVAPGYSGIVMGYQSYPIVMGYAQLRAFYDSYNQETYNSHPYNSPYLQIYHIIFLNHADVINLFDADGTLARLQKVENSIQIAAYRAGAQVSVIDNLAGAINSYRGWLQSSLFVFYIFSLPVLPVSWYLSMTSWYMTTSRRRREFGLLKVRGISGRGIFRTTILEAAVVGVVGAIIGVLAGFLVGSVIASLLGSQSTWNLSLNAITPEILELGLFLGVLLSILAALRPARMASNLQPTEAVKEYLGEEMEVGKPWRPTWTWAAVVLGSYKMLEWIFNFSPSTLFPTGVQGGNFVVSILFVAWSILSGALIVLGPFFFVYGVTKLITRSQNRLYTSTSLILRSFMKDLSHVTSRALSRNPARVSRVAFLIALTLTFGILVNVAFASMWDMTLRSTRVQVGADFNVRAYSSSFNESFTSNLTAINGVSGVTPIMEGSGSTPFIGVSGVTVYGINASNFLDIVYRDEAFTAGPPEVLFQSLRQSSDSALLSQGLADYLGLRVGDGFELDQSGQTGMTGTVATHFKVAGFYKFLPGVTASNVYYGPAVGSGPNYWGGSILANLAYLRTEGVNPTMGFTFLGKLASGTDAEQVASSIQLRYGSEIFVDTYQSRLAQLNQSAAGTGIFKFLELTSGYLLLAAVIGFAVISWANTSERLGEIAVFRSRGTTRNQALKILFSESFAVLLIALAIGVFTGLLSAYGLLRFFTSGSLGTNYGGLDPRLVVPVELWVMLVASIGGFLISILIPAWLSLRRTVIQTVRFR